jgi:hypothetical protein
MSILGLEAATRFVLAAYPHRAGEFIVEAGRCSSPGRAGIDESLLLNKIPAGGAEPGRSPGWREQRCLESRPRERL